MSLASWIRRAGAAVVDWAVFLVPVVAAAVIGSAVSSPDAANVVAGVGLILALAVMLYSRWFRGGTTGQSWGRRVFKIRLVNIHTGKPLGAGKAFVRDVCHVFDYFLFCFGFLRPLWNMRHQTFADTIMDSVVVTS